MLALPMLLSDSIADNVCVYSAAVLLLGVVYKCKLYEDARTILSWVARRAAQLPRMQHGDGKLVGGFVLAVAGLYLLFKGAECRSRERAQKEDSAALSSDSEFRLQALQSHRKWFTRSKIVRSLATVVLVNFMLTPVQEQTIDALTHMTATLESEARYDTAVVVTFLLVYLLSHDDYYKRATAGSRTQ